MSILWENRIVADTTFKGLSGQRAVGGYLMRFSIGFEVKNWTEADPPVVTLLNGWVTLTAPSPMVIGVAIPESAAPFQSSTYSHSPTLLFECVLSPGSLEALEEIRKGGDMTLVLKIRGVIERNHRFVSVTDDVACRINQTDWLGFLEQCGFGRTMLFEIPLPLATGAESTPTQTELLQARQQFLQGHYRESIATCRRVLETLTHELGEDADLSKAQKLFKEARDTMSAFERELMLRQLAMNYSHPAHHAARGMELSFDRSDAAMLLGITAALVAKGLDRH